MAVLVRTTEISNLPGGSYKLAVPIKVAVYLEPRGIFRASAPELSMWSDGLGHTESDAVEDLSEEILDQRQSISEYSSSDCSEYARTIKAVFEDKMREA